MKTVRLFYEKKGGMRFCSHLDMTRFMARVIRRAKLPVWYTEGFNPHLYMTFALPLPLGFFSTSEIMDIRIIDDTFDISSIPETLNSFCPDGIHFTDCSEALKKPADIAAATYSVLFDDKGALLPALKEFLSGDSLTVTKKTKRGEEKALDIKEKTSVLSLKTDANADTLLQIKLPAGNELNISPELIITAFFESGKTEYYCYTVTRTAVLDKSGKDFK